MLLLLTLCVAAPRAEEKAADVDSAAADRTGFVIAPVVGYAPETLFLFGVAGIHHFQLGRDFPPSRLSLYRFNLVYTLKNQAIAQVDYDINLPGDKVQLNGQLKYALFPDRYYGTGNRSAADDREDFNSRYWRLQLNSQRRLGSDFHVGLHLEMFIQSIVETESGGLLASGTIPGSRGMSLFGAGIYGKWDNRDNIFSASRGSYLTLALNHFSPLLGSDHTFTQLQLDGRHYVAVGRDSVLAFQGVFKTTWGECPFQTLPMFGGAYLLRGFYEGRFRDQSLLALQLEYRLPLWGRFGLCGFAGLAQVQPDPGLFSLNGFHSATGIGLRYKFNRRENLNIRLDVGFADSAPAFYLTFAEAF
jgi:outer membrane protein assembly factor BamA